MGWEMTRSTATSNPPSHPLSRMSAGLLPPPGNHFAAMVDGGPSQNTAPCIPEGIVRFVGPL